jgi:hypothetical protein
MVMNSGLEGAEEEVVVACLNLLSWVILQPLSLPRIAYTIQKHLISS